MVQHCRIPPWALLLKCLIGTRRDTPCTPNTVFLEIKKLLLANGNSTADERNLRSFKNKIKDFLHAELPLI